MTILHSRYNGDTSMLNMSANCVSRPMTLSSPSKSRISTEVLAERSLAISQKYQKRKQQHSCSPFCFKGLLLDRFPCSASIRVFARLRVASCCSALIYISSRSNGIQLRITTRHRSRNISFSRSYVERYLKPI